jgi:putative acetyltransferase
MGASPKAEQSLGDVTIRAEHPEDRHAIAGVVAAAFGSPSEARLVERIRSSANFVPELSLVAEFEGHIIGHVMISFVVLRDNDAQRRIANLSPLAVAPEFQGQGVGSALVREVIARADDRGEPLPAARGPGRRGRVAPITPRRHHATGSSNPDAAPLAEETRE